jgi:hypothetical protein
VPPYVPRHFVTVHLQAALTPVLSPLVQLAAPSGDPARP